MNSQGIMKHGVDISSARSTREALEIAGLDYQVQKIPQYIDWKGGRIATGDYATVRADTGQYLGTVKEGYGIVQNPYAFEPFGNVLFDEGLKPVRAGSIEGGARAWLAFEKEQVKMRLNGNSEDLGQWIILFNSFDGAMKVSIMPFMLRLVCTNGLVVWTASGVVGFRHTASVKQQIEAASRNIESSLSKASDAIQVFSQMPKLPLKKEVSVSDYFEATIPGLKKRNDKRLKRNRWKGDYEQLMENFHHGRGNTGKNLWHAYNAVTEWVDHQRFSNYSAEDWSKTTFFSQGFRFKQSAFTAAEKLLRQNKLLN